MTRTMYDGVGVQNIPANATMVAAYIDGRWANFAAMRTRFPHAQIVTIATQANTLAGDVLDVETGNATPEQAVTWVKARRAAGADPSVYCNQSNGWAPVKAAFAAAGVALPHFWVAHYDNDPTIPTGAVAKQYRGDVAPGFDQSSVATYWPGIDKETPMTIAYDQPVLDLIAGLDATGHITHANDTKTMVTFHHNGGIFTAQQVLNIWKTRAASAHFDVDKDGQIAQYANVHDYAWACANTLGNQTSISIEMSNSTTAPQWLVAPETWQKAARLAGWLFANVIKAAPTSANVVFHSHWYATACAGPYMDSVYPQLLAAVQAAYKQFIAPGPTPKPPVPTTKLTVDGYMGQATVNRWAAVMGTHTGRHDLIVAVQTYLNSIGCRDENGNQLVVDGVCDLDNTAKATAKQHTTAAVQRHLGTTIDGVWSHPSSGVKVLQARLNAAKTGSKEF